MPDFMPGVGSRRWIAWKLVQLAAKVYDAEYCERISITDPEGTEVSVLTVVNSGYGHGVTGGNSSNGYKWQWEEFVPDWWESSNV